jgi:DNA-binding GntR family transcriptional regulator
LCQSRAGLGLSEHTARRALRLLEAAGLVSVLRKPGRGLEVTVMDVPHQEK